MGPFNSSVLYLLKADSLGSLTNAGGAQEVEVL